MALTDFKDTILFIDDEQFVNVWVIDFLEDAGFQVETCENLDEAISKIEEGVYRAAVIDLNIPASSSFNSELVSQGEVFLRYPGLYAAFRARNKGYRDRQVIIYSVHKDPAVAKVASSLSCSYLLKERPALFIEELKEVLSYDPTTQDTE